MSCEEFAILPSRFRPDPVSVHQPTSTSHIATLPSDSLLLLATYYATPVLFRFMPSFSSCISHYFLLFPSSVFSETFVHIVSRFSSFCFHCYRSVVATRFLSHLPSSFSLSHTIHCCLFSLFFSSPDSLVSDHSYLPIYNESSHLFPS